MRSVLASVFVLGLMVISVFFPFTTTSTKASIIVTDDPGQTKGNSTNSSMLETKFVVLESPVEIREGDKPR